MKKYKKTYVEITNVCNLDCDFCPKTKRKSSFMSRELFERILMEMKGRTKFLYLHIKGEPFLHPQLKLFLDLCKEYDYTVNITTNGTLIDKDMDDLVYKSALRQINFSLHSFEGNDNKYTMDSYLDKIFRFIHKALEVRALQICLRLWNLSEVSNLEVNNYVLRRIEREFELEYTIEDKLTPCNGIKMVENVFLNQAERFEWPDTNNQFVGNQGFCYGLREQVGFLVDGTVVPCCLDGEGVVNLGNIEEQDFEEILKGRRAAEFYKGFCGKKIVEELCQKCSFRTRFKS